MSTAAFCPNCYHPDPGDYCPQCGQKQAERRVSLRLLFAEFLDEQFGVNNRLPRTLKLLLLRPGHLTNEYFGGRIAQYIPPLRLYLLTSVVFFALFLVAESSSVNIYREADAAEERIAADTALQRKVRTRTETGHFVGIRVPYADTDNWVRDAEVNFLIPSLTRAAQRNLQELSTLGQHEATRRIIRTVLAQMPKVFFIFLPIYAFLLFLFFHRQRRYYVEHFVMALHLHSFAFLTLLPLPIFDMPVFPKASAAIGDFISAPLLLWVFTYVFIALKRVYAQGWVPTAAKYSLLWILYMIFFICGVLVAAVLALTVV
ncbi:MAG TPA: DUF3667 domain-containing protein [Longimicrobiales bacterium]|nr:DUF3667 domain-containing protein [Longimicrobiales bacterium]